MDEIFDRGAAYVELDAAGNEQVVYRASALGRCVGALVRSRLGMTGSAPPDAMQERFDEGHDWEERVILAGLGVDWTLLDRRKLGQYGTVVEGEHGEVQVETEIVWGEDGARKVIRCHPDGIAVSGNRFSDDGAGSAERRVVEAKFFGPDLYYQMAKELSYPYAMQLSIEMLSTGLPALYVMGLKGRMPSGELFIDDVTVMEFDTPPLRLAEIKMKVLEVEGYVARGEIPPCPVPFDYPCPYWADHDAPEKVVIEDDEMQRLVAAYEVMLEEKEYVDAGMELLKQQILDRANELGVSSGGCGGWTLSVVTPQQGNVSWAKAYKELSKITGERVDEDQFRGETGKQHVRLKKDEG